MTENNNDQNSTDDFSDIDATLKELGIELDDDGNPTSLASGAEDEDTIKKRQHAYATLKRKYKEERTAREKADAEAQALKEKINQSGNANNTPPPSGGTSQATQLMQRLKMVAMQELGLTKIDTAEELELVSAHSNVVYQRLLNQQEAVTKAEAGADAFVAGELGKYDLEDEDLAEVKKRVKALSPLDQTDGNRVRSVVAGYIGEKLLSGDMVSPSSSGGTDSNGIDASSARAASHSALSTGRGVRLGKASKGSGEVKPATPAELAEMKKVGLSDVKMYREAKARSGQYKD